MPETPDNAAYLIAGLIVAFGILGVFVASLVIRFRNLRNNIRLIEQIGEEEA